MADRALSAGRRTGTALLRAGDAGDAGDISAALARGALYLLLFLWRYVAICYRRYYPFSRACSETIARIARLSRSRRGSISSAADLTLSSLASDTAHGANNMTDGPVNYGPGNGLRA
jgi:hypothetical protein